MGRKLRRFKEEPTKEEKDKAKQEAKNDTRSEIHFYKTDCFSHKFNNKNRSCLSCVYSELCEEKQTENLATIKSCELDYRKVYVHDQIESKEPIYELRPLKELSKLFVPAIVTKTEAVISLPILAYSSFTKEIYDFLGIRGKNYITCLHPFLRSDFGILTILKVTPCKLSEFACCNILINTDL